MRLATANLGRGVSAERFRANVVRLAARMAGGFVCFQEIDEADSPNEHAIVRQVMRVGWWFAGAHQRTMIAVPRSWRRIDGSVQRLCDGVAGATPARNAVTIAVKPRFRPGLPTIAVMSAHLPYVNPRHPKPLQDSTRAAWQHAHRALCAEVRYWADSRGMTVFIAADTNEPLCPRPHPEARLLLGAGQIDKVWVVERSVHLRLTDTSHMRMTIDGHDAQIIRGALER